MLHGALVAHARRIPRSGADRGGDARRRQLHGGGGVRGAGAASLQSGAFPYFERLTGITNEQLAQGVDFRTAYERFLVFAGEGPVAAFGRDEKVLEENLRLYSIKDAKPLPLFYDLRGWFAVQGVDPRGRHSCEIGPQLGVPFAGRIHNALDDVKSLAAGMERIAARSAGLKPAA